MPLNGIPQFSLILFFKQGALFSHYVDSVLACPAAMTLENIVVFLVYRPESFPTALEVNIPCHKSDFQLFACV